MKSLLNSLVLLFLILLCSSPLKAAHKTTIEVACYPSLDEGFRQILPDFYRAYPSIEVKLKVAGYGDHHNMLVTSVAAGEGVPDAAVIEIGYIAQFVAEGGLSDLSQPPFRAKRFKKDIIPSFYSYATTDSARLIALPLESSPGCVYWRRDLFEDAGVNIEEIKTMDDLFTAAGRLTRDTDKDGKIDRWFTSNSRNIAWMILRSKQYLFLEDYNITWDFNHMKEAFLWAQKFQQAGYAANIEPWSTDLYDGFRNGTVAYEPSGAWLGWHLKHWMAPNTAGKWGVARWPALNGNSKSMAGSWGGSFLAIPQASIRKDDAWAFVKFACTNKQSQLKLYQISNAFPAYMPTWKESFFQEPIDFYAGQPARRLWIEIANEVPPLITSRIDNVVNAVVGSELEAVIQEGKDVDQALKDVKSNVYFCRRPRYITKKRKNF